MKKTRLWLIMAVVALLVTPVCSLAQTTKEQIATLKRIQDETPALRDQQNAFLKRSEALKAEKLETEEMSGDLSQAFKAYYEKTNEIAAESSDYRDEFERYKNESDQLNSRYVNTYDGDAVNAYNREVKRLNKWADRLREKQSDIKSRLNSLTSYEDTLKVRQGGLNEKREDWDNKAQSFNNEWSDFLVKIEEIRSQLIAACNGLMSKPKTQKTALKLGCGNPD